MASEAGSPSMRSPTAPSLSRFASTSSLDSLGARSPILSRLPSSGWTKGVGMGGDPSLQKKRARNLLRDYYGLAQGGAGDKGKARDEVGFEDDDLDSPRFDPARHAERLMASETVAELLKTANRLSREARELDGERQGLVYNHHHELVEASGTIGKMKEAAETLDTSLDQLQASFSSISSLAGSLARPAPPHPLPPSAPKFDPLTHLPPLLALPALLRSLASPRDRTPADRLWGEWEPALRSFEEAGIAGAKEIGQECREVLRSARRNSLGSPELGGRPSISVA